MVLYWFVFIDRVEHSLPSKTNYFQKKMFFPSFFSHFSSYNTSLSFFHGVFCFIPWGFFFI